MNKRISLGVTIGMMMLVAAITFSITFNVVDARYNNRINDLRERENAQEKYAEIDRQVRENYLGTIDDTQLLDSVAKGYLAGIGDKHAAYYDARTYERVLRAQDNPVADIGAVLEAGPDGYLLVKEVYPDSPALAANIQAGDLITKIDNVDLTPENSAAMLETVQGEQGTKITLTVRSANTDRIEELTRRVVVVPSVYSRMIGDTQVGYIIIQEFNTNTPDQFKRELERVIGQGAQSLIFDLRDNKGGRLSSATRMLDRLLPTGPIVSALDKDGNIIFQESSDATEIMLPMVALINAGTASSAEVFVQALKDYNKVRTVGVTTTGKGSMQTTIKLSDGSAIEITTGILITTGGESFDEVGIKPDYEVTMEDPWQNLDENLDPQLKKAVEVAVATHRVGEATQQQGESSEAAQPEQPPASLPEISQSEPSQEEISEPEPDESSEESAPTDEEPGDEGGEGSEESSLEE